LTSHFQHGGHDVISRRKVLPSGDCTRSGFPTHVKQRRPAAHEHFCLQFLRSIGHALVLLLKAKLCDELRRPADSLLKLDDNYVLSHQRFWTFDILVCPLSATERFLLQPLVCGTVFHHTSLLSPSLSSAIVLNHNYLFSLSYSAF